MLHMTVIGVGFPHRPASPQVARTGSSYILHKPGEFYTGLGIEPECDLISVDVELFCRTEMNFDQAEYGTGVNFVL